MKETKENLSLANHLKMTKGMSISSKETITEEGLLFQKKKKKNLWNGWK